MNSRKTSYTVVVLMGFRGTGKSTLGPLIAKKLRWEYQEMDHELVKRSGKTIAELTKQGTSWKDFRKQEYELFQELLQKPRIVIAAGGGVGVNNFFGDREAQLLKETRQAFTVVLTASDEVVAQRIKNDEARKKALQRPLLDEQKAKKIDTLLRQYEHDIQKQKEILIQEIVADSLSVFTQRKPLYKKLADIVVDTSILYIEEAVNFIIDTMHV